MGSRLDVLFESFDGEYWCGHSDTYILVKAKGENLHGIMKNVYITGIDGDSLVSLSY